MSARMLLGGIVLVVVTAMFTATVVSQEDQPTPKEGEQKMDPQMEAWLKYAAPGPHHEHLKALAGKWQTEGKMRMSPEQPWETTSGTAEAEWVLGGRFLHQSAKGKMGAEGSEMDFEGLGYFGYNNYERRYESAWMDNMSTLIFMQTGTCDDSGKVITMTGEYKDPMTGTTKKSKLVYRIEGADKYVLEMFDTTPDGQEFNCFQLTYTRKG